MNLRDSFKYLSIEEYLISKEIWEKNKNALIKKAGLSGFADYNIVMSKLKEYLDILRKVESSSDHKELRNIFKQTVSGYSPEKEIVDVIYLQQNKPS